MAQGTVTFDGAPPPGTINLGIGQPSADLLPVGLVHRASEAFFACAEPFELNYGVIAGDARFLQSLAGFLSTGYGATVTADTLFATGGNSQALDLVSSVFAKPGDTVFVEEPSYFLAFQIFRDHHLNVVGIPMTQDGPDIEALRLELDRTTPAFFYTIPSFHNPTGWSSTAPRRQQIVSLAEENGFLVVADEPYQHLFYYAEPPPAFGTMIASEVVLSLGSFSKILAPGMRLGWIQTCDELRRQILGNGFVNSGGSINHISSHIVRHAIDAGLLDNHIARLRTVLRGRVEAMDAALHEHFDGLATWTRPDGGYFFWLRFDESVDAAALRRKAPGRETGFQAGDVFSAAGQFGNYVRLSFAHYNEEDIREGIARMRPLFD
ncbi:MAG: PLP-dependent aminotransferase family protein [Gammaproteobacteria bacterium]|nr:PLP-dependent aminotransferase family protein [Gammaproteobacteria bacterium]